MTIQIEKLLKMAEQITDNLAYTEDEEVVAAKVADHLNRFWDPRMRCALIDHASTAENQLSPTLARAVAQLQS